MTYLCECIVFRRIGSYHDHGGTTTDRRQCRGLAVVHGVWQGPMPGEWGRQLCCSRCITVLERTSPPTFMHEPAPECIDPNGYFDAVENRCRTADPDLVKEVEDFLRHPANQKEDAPC